MNMTHKSLFGRALSAPESQKLDLDLTFVAKRFWIHQLHQCVYSIKTVDLPLDSTNWWSTLRGAPQNSNLVELRKIIHHYYWLHKNNGSISNFSFFLTRSRCYKVGVGGVRRPIAGHEPSSAAARPVPPAPPAACSRHGQPLRRARGAAPTIGSLQRVDTHMLASLRPHAQNLPRLARARPWLYAAWFHANRGRRSSFFHFIS
jgi:hypothetical protein